MKTEEYKHYYENFVRGSSKERENFLGPTKNQ